MTENIAVITGANKGIGFEAAKGLAARGVKVLMAARSEERGRKAADTLKAEGLNVEFLHLDVTDEDTIAAAVKQVESQYGRLDILVNNAAVALADGDWNTSELTVATMRTTFETNVIGVVAATNAFLPLLRRAEAARIVNVSSEIGSLAVMSNPDFVFAQMQPGAYGASKSALNMLTVSYAKELKDTPIKVNVVTPGYTATDLNNNQGYRTPEEGARILIELALTGGDAPTGTFQSDGTITYLDGKTVPW